MHKRGCHARTPYSDSTSRVTVSFPFFQLLFRLSSPRSVFSLAFCRFAHIEPVDSAFGSDKTDTDTWPLSLHAFVLRVVPGQLTRRGSRCCAMAHSPRLRSRHSTRGASPRPSPLCVLGLHGCMKYAFAISHSISFFFR